MKSDNLARQPDGSDFNSETHLIYLADLIFLIVVLILDGFLLHKKQREELEQAATAPSCSDNPWRKTGKKKLV